MEGQAIGFTPLPHLRDAGYRLYPSCYMPAIDAYTRHLGIIKHLFHLFELYLDSYLQYPMQSRIFFSFLILLSLSISAQERSHTIYNKEGKEVNFKKMVKSVDATDIILFGELHNNPISHWLQLELTKKLNESNQLILAAEMLERDNQNELNDYLAGTINAKGLDTLARLWKNHKTDYAPLVNFAKDNKLNFIAANIPRHLANLVYKKGFEALDTLTVEQKTWIAPLPIAFDKDLPTYQKILEMMGEHGTPELVKAQAIKDATMAHSILENYKDSHTLIHYNGAYHSDYYEGIGWYLKRQRADLKYATISTVEQADISKLEKEHLGKADFIICVDEDMTKTY